MLHFEIRINIIKQKLGNYQIIVEERRAIYVCNCSKLCFHCESKGAGKKRTDDFKSESGRVQEDGGALPHKEQ